MTSVRLFLIIVGFILAGENLIVAQKPFRELSEKYKQQNNFFASELGKRTIKLYLKEKNPGEEVRKVLENIDQLCVLTFSMSGVGQVPVFIDDADNSYNFSGYTPFKNYRNTFENKMVFLKESGETFSDLVVITSSMEKVTLVEIKGKIDLEKTAMIKEALKIDGIDALSAIENENALKRKELPEQPAKRILPYQPYGNRAPRDGFRFWLIDDDRLSGQDSKPKNFSKDILSFTNPDKTYGSDRVAIYDKTGSKLIGSYGSPMLYINGFASKNDFQSSLQGLNPECIQSINYSKSNGDKPSGMIEVDLKGDANDAFTVCEGMLYFGQNGYIQSVMIDDDCGPALLINCHETPISDIVLFNPDDVKSIQLTTDPRNCGGKLPGEYVVVELK